MQYKQVNAYTSVDPKQRNMMVAATLSSSIKVSTVDMSQSFVEVPTQKKDRQRVQIRL